MDNFVYHDWGCTLINHPLSYPFRSLIINIVIFILYFQREENTVGLVIERERLENETDGLR